LLSFALLLCSALAVGRAAALLLLSLALLLLHDLRQLEELLL
jgi:hypothetical protein